SVTKHRMIDCTSSESAWDSPRAVRRFVSWRRLGLPRRLSLAPCWSSLAGRRPGRSLPPFVGGGSAPGGGGEGLKVGEFAALPWDAAGSGAGGDGGAEGVCRSRPS